VLGTGGSRTSSPDGGPGCLQDGARNAGGGVSRTRKRSSPPAGCLFHRVRPPRVTDPLYSIGNVVLRNVVEQARVPCGLPRPLTRGATSKVILAQLTSRRLAKLLDNGRKKSAPLPKSESEFRDELVAIRKRGYSITRGEVDRHVVGIAAPVSVPERALIGSLSLVVPAPSLDSTLERRLLLLALYFSNCPASSRVRPAQRIFLAPGRSLSSARRNHTRYDDLESRR
jgi:Bacterial transcriptional regulator